MNPMSLASSRRALVALLAVALIALLFTVTICYCAIMEKSLDAHIESILMIAATTMFGALVYIARGSTAPPPKDENPADTSISIEATSTVPAKPLPKTK